MRTHRDIGILINPVARCHQICCNLHMQAKRDRVNSKHKLFTFNLAQQCKNEGEIFLECGLSCARSCNDLSLDIKCNEECVAGCQCPNGQLLNDKSRCIPIAQCPCPFEGKMIQPGESISVGNCKTWYGWRFNSYSWVFSISFCILRFYKRDILYSNIHYSRCLVYSEDTVQLKVMCFKTFKNTFVPPQWLQLCVKCILFIYLSTCNRGSMACVDDRDCDSKG